MRLKPYGKNIIATILWNRDEVRASGLILAEEGMPPLRKARVESAGPGCSDAIKEGCVIVFRNFMALDEMKPEQIIVPEIFVEAVLDPT